MIKAERAIAYLRQLGLERDGAIFSMGGMQQALYHVQATGLGWYGKPVLKETFVAYRFGARIPRVKDAFKRLHDEQRSRYLQGPVQVGHIPRWIRGHLDWVFEHYVRPMLVGPCSCGDEGCTRQVSYDPMGTDSDWVCRYVRRFLIDEDDPRLFVIPESVMRTYYESQFKIWGHPDLQKLKEYTPSDAQSC